MTMARLTRRGLFARATAAGVGLTLASPGIGSAFADTSDEFALLRQRLLTIMNGAAFDPTDPDFTAGVAAINDSAQSAQGKVIAEPNRTQVFSDLAFHNGVSADMRDTYVRLQAMALAYITPGAALHGDQVLLDQILAGLRTAYTLVYNENSSAYGNWFHWEISGPQAMVNTCIFLYDNLTPSEIDDYCRAVDHFVADPGMYFSAPNSDFPDRVPRESSGSNRMLMCSLVIQRGVLGGTEERIDLGLSRLDDVLEYAELNVDNIDDVKNDGFYRDGSFIHHRTSPATGTYGSDFLVSIASIAALLGGSRWGSTSIQVVTDSIEKTFVPVIFNGHRMESVMERAVTRRRSERMALSIIRAIMTLADGAEPAIAHRWRNIVKGWLLRNPATPDIVPNEPMAHMARMKAILADSTLDGTPEPIGLVIFPRMSRAVVRGDGWAYAIAMSSERVAHYAHQSTENLRGFHTGSGMTYLYTDDDTRAFADAYWPTANVYGHAGTTVDTRPQPNAVATGRIPENSWAGGSVLHGEVGAVGQDLRGINSAMYATKSWFALGDRIVCLGAGITDPVDPTEGHPVVTTVEHRNLGEAGVNELTVDGHTQPVNQGWNAIFANPGWAHLADTAGYVMLDGAVSLKASRDERTGQWGDIDTATGGTDDITRRYVSLWFDHGVTPNGATYAYLVLPRATADDTAAVAASPAVDVLANTAAVQAVRVPGRQRLVLANFFEAGTVERVTADGSCSVVAEMSPSCLTVAVADPTQHRDSLTVTLRCGVWQVDTADPSVTASSVAPDTVITVDTSSRDGATHTVTFVR